MERIVVLACDLASTSGAAKQLARGAERLAEIFQRASADLQHVLDDFSLSDDLAEEAGAVAELLLAWREVGEVGVVFATKMLVLGDALRSSVAELEIERQQRLKEADRLNKALREACAEPIAPAPQPRSWLPWRNQPEPEPVDGIARREHQIAMTRCLDHCADNMDVALARGRATLERALLDSRAYARSLGEKVCTLRSSWRGGDGWRFLPEEVARSSRSSSAVQDCVTQGALPADSPRAASQRGDLEVALDAEVEAEVEVRGNVEEEREMEEVPERLVAGDAIAKNDGPEGSANTEGEIIGVGTSEAAPVVNVVSPRIAGDSVEDLKHTGRRAPEEGTESQVVVPSRGCSEDAPAECQEAIPLEGVRESEVVEEEHSKDLAEPQSETNVAELDAFETPQIALLANAAPPGDALEGNVSGQASEELDSPLLSSSNTDAQITPDAADASIDESSCSNPRPDVAVSGASRGSTEMDIVREDVVTTMQEVVDEHNLAVDESSATAQAISKVVEAALPNTGEDIPSTQLSSAQAPIDALQPEDDTSAQLSHVQSEEPATDVCYQAPDQEKGDFEGSVLSDHVASWHTADENDLCGSASGAEREHAQDSARPFDLHQVEVCEPSFGSALWSALAVAVRHAEDGGESDGSLVANQRDVPTDASDAVDGTSDPPPESMLWTALVDAAQSTELVGVDAPGTE